MDGLVGNVHGFGLTLDEIERLVKVHGCKWLRYYWEIYYWYCLDCNKITVMEITISGKKGQIFIKTKKGRW